MENLLAQIGLIVNKYEEIEKVNATNFNIFSILKLERNEVETHSYFIYELLNPQGTHNQGDIFVKLFITTVLGLDINDDSVIKVKREDLTSNNRRIDFTIQTSKYQIGIEMKIDAQDQDEQLNDYLIELKKNAVNSQEAKLYYLTLFGYEASKSSVRGLKLNKDYYAISFSVEILKWLEKCIEKSATIPILREGLVQYKNLINKITNKTDKNKEKQMHSIIGTQTNMKLAGDIIKEYPKIWAKKELEFWNNLRDNLQEEIPKEFEIKDYLDIWEDENNKEKFDDDKVLENIINIRQKKYYSVGFAIKYQIDKNIKVDLYICEWNDTISIYFAVYKNNSDDLIMNDKLELITNDIGLTRKDKNERYKYIDKKITFYGRYQTEPSYELFDNDKFNEAINYVNNEIISIATKIKDERNNIINAIK